MTHYLPQVSPVACGRRVVLAQARLAVEEEHALSLDDVLLRRIAPGALDLEACRELAEPVAREMADLLGWSRDELDGQVEAFRQGAAADLGAARGEPPARA
jgi:glycerol-3-phosphate dehydrogenase